MIEIKKYDDTLLSCNSCGANKELHMILIKYGVLDSAGGLSIVLCEECKKELMRKLNN